MILGVWQAYQLGSHDAGGELVSLRESHRKLKHTMAELERRNAALQEQTAILERSSQVDNEAYRKVARDLQKMESQLLQQRKELEFYRGIVSPGQAKTGLRIQSLELIPEVTPGRFRYTLLLTQVNNNNRDIRGVVQMQVNGSAGGVSKSLSLAEVSEPKRDNWEFRFRYFQTLEGALQLPAGFTADTLRVEVLPEGKGQPQLTRTFHWPA